MTPYPRPSRILASALLAAAAVAAVAAPAPLPAQDLESFEARTTVHTLDNGWTFIIVRRPEAPVFSFATLVDVGAAQEVPGITGLAHMFEHVAFKGTPVVGTTDWEAEREALARLEAAYQAYQAERFSQDPDPEELQALEEAFRKRQEEAAQYARSSEYGTLIEEEGGVGLNAFTSADVTGYFYSLPSNKLELFAYLESERFLRPVFREFYKERSVVQEERRLRTESNPVGRLVEQFVSTAYQAHPYGQPVVGHMSDLQAFTMTDAEDFFETYYAPSNMVTAVVGDVDPETLIPLLETYFGRIPGRGEAPTLRTEEPSQAGEKVVTIPDAAQPYYLEGYHKPSVTHRDQAVYDAVDDVLTRGRTSRLYRRLVRDERLAVNVQSFSGFPGDKYPNLWAVFVVPAPDVSNERIQAVVHEELARLADEGVSDQELERFRTRSRADLIRSLQSNQGLARELADAHRLFGDWRELFRYLERLEEVTSEDVRRVAGETLVQTNRTVAQIVTESAEPEPPEPEPEAAEPAGEEPGTPGAGEAASQEALR